MDNKKWYLSRTLWLGAIAVIVAAVKAVDSGANWESIVLAIFGALAVFLRTQTNLPLGK